MRMVRKQKEEPRTHTKQHETRPENFVFRVVSQIIFGLCLDSMCSDLAISSSSQVSLADARGLLCGSNRNIVWRAFPGVRLTGRRAYNLCREWAEFNS